MNVDYNKHNIVKYLANNKDKDIWKMSVSSIGFQSTKFLDSYPPKGHPFGYTFNPERGRILDEFSLIYITKGRGTFQSGNCSEKKITKGDVFLLATDISRTDLHDDFSVNIHFYLSNIVFSSPDVARENDTCPFESK